MVLWQPLVLFTSVSLLDLVELVNTYYTQGHIIVVFVDILISLWMYI